MDGEISHVVTAVCMILLVGIGTVMMFDLQMFSSRNYSYIKRYSRIARPTDTTFRDRKKTCYALLAFL